MRFEQVFNAFPAALAIIRLADGRFVDVNRRFLELTELRRDAVVGCAADSGILVALHDEILPSLDAMRSRQRTEPIEVPFRTKSGGRRPVSIAFERMEIEGEPCVLVVAQDLIPQHEVGEKLVQISEHEQSRLARDLHDHLSQELGAVVLLVERLQVGLRNGRTNVASAVDQTDKIFAILERCIQEVHSLVRGLSLASLTCCRKSK